MFAFHPTFLGGNQEDIPAVRKGEETKGVRLRIIKARNELKGYLEHINQISIHNLAITYSYMFGSKWENSWCC